ncbi:fimbrial protein [Enterobacter asburiae]|uniref:fimbrial protein n=1 Tax=Enterobacter asburiae TaxID=61645 RepID=UPI0032AFD00F
MNTTTNIINMSKILMTTILLSFFISFLAKSAPTSTTVTISGTVIPRTCALDEKVKQIILPDVMRNDLMANEHAGHTQFSIDISSCALAINQLMLTITGTPTSGVMKSSYFLNTGTSTDVALALWFTDGKKPITPESDNKVVVPITNGSGSINVTAAYAESGSNVTAGTFSSTIEVYFEYM